MIKFKTIDGKEYVSGELLSLKKDSVFSRFATDNTAVLYLAGESEAPYHLKFYVLSNVDTFDGATPDGNEWRKYGYKYSYRFSSIKQMSSFFWLPEELLVSADDFNNFCHEQEKCPKK